jgi:hypothetical protein
MKTIVASLLVGIAIATTGAISATAAGVDTYFTDLSRTGSKWTGPFDDLTRTAPVKDGYFGELERSGP